MTDSELQEAKPAATLVLFRDREGMPPEILMVERSAGMAFAGGAVVFPGGRVDPDDHLIAQRFPDYEQDDAAARIAAIRETIEESLIAIGVVGNVSETWLDEARVWLHDRKPFSELLDAAGLTLDLSVMHYFARWRPPFREARVFDTRFFVARAPHDLPPPVVDETENVRTFWESAERVIALSGEGRVKVIFPTMRNLERLALFGSFDEAVAHLQEFEVKMIGPLIEEREDGRYLCIPEGLGYPVTAERLDLAQTAYRRDTFRNPDA
jgi:8-oxo-dGTP pyrophosphatase MutT (NUDIX family)